MQQKSYFDASIKNTANANTIMLQMQGAILTIVIAELALLGTSELTKTRPSDFAVLAVGMLLIALILFVLGFHAQWRPVIRAARIQFRISRKIHEFILEKSIDTIGKMPRDIRALDKRLNSLTTSPQANGLFLSAILLIFIATILILIMFTRRVQW